MLKRFFVTSLGAWLLSSAWLVPPGVTAQGGKPSQALRQVLERQAKIQEDFDREISDGKAKTTDREPLDEKLRQFAAERAAGFNIADWKGDELLALASLYSRAEIYARAAEAYRAILAKEKNERLATNIRLRLARALVEAEQFEEAQKVLDELFREMPKNSVELSLRVGLHKDLAANWRDQGKYPLALKQAQRGFDLAEGANKLPRYDQRLLDTVGLDQMSLAAIATTSLERVGLTKEAAEFHTRMQKRDFGPQVNLKSFYESELIAARLIGGRAPELDAAVWINSEPIKLADLRGKVIMLDFWAMWCTSCTNAFPRWQEFQKKFSGKGLEIIGVTKLYGRSDTEDGLTREKELTALQSFRVKQQLSYPIAVGKMDDVTNDERYGIAGLPTVVLIDRRGNVRHIRRDAGDYRDLEKRIEKLLNEN